MTPGVVPFPAIQTCIEFIHDRLFPVFKRSSACEDMPEDARHRREFIHEVLERNPDAFTSDLDVQCMMQMYPGQF